MRLRHTVYGRLEAVWPEVYMITTFGLSVRFVSVRASPFVDYHPAPRVRAKGRARRYAAQPGTLSPG